MLRDEEEYRSSYDDYSVGKKARYNSSISDMD
jgi:hypothetical protein